MLLEFGDLGFPVICALGRFLVIEMGTGLLHRKDGDCREDRDLPRGCPLTP